jgi:glycosyltransferase involved in cell wall biosynthesis
LYERYESSDAMAVLVAYWSLRDGSNGVVDPGFGRAVDWGLSLLHGYRYVCLTGTGRGRRLRGLAAIWRLIRGGAFDVVVSYGYNFPAAWVSLASAKASRTRWVFLGDNHKIDSISGNRRPGKRIFLKTLAWLADGIFAGSVRSQEFYRRFGGSKVRLVPHAIDDQRFVRDAGLNAYVPPNRHRDETVFLFVGKLVANKRVADVIRAVGCVANAALWIVGTGAEEEALRQLARPLRGRVTFLGFLSQTQLPAVFSAADVVVLPSAFETFGLSVSEGAAVGCTAIVSDACGVVDSLVVDKVSGLVYPVGDVDALAAAMRDMTDARIRSELSQGMKRIGLGWTSQSNVAAFTRACASVVDSRRFDTPAGR